MKMNELIQCNDFPCTDIRVGGYSIPEIELDPEAVSVVLISEASPPYPRDGYYAGPGSLFERTTVQAFQDAGASFNSISDLLKAGVYLTPAVKCAKTGYGIDTSTIQNCARLLEQELALFPNVKAYLLMGDVAIKAFNTIVRHTGEGRVIPAGSTYKLRGQSYFYRGARVFPSYLQAGPSFFIEKSKRKMIAEDLSAALQLIGRG